jgi:hypothetical protein
MSTFVYIVFSLDVEKTRKIPSHHSKNSEVRMQNPTHMFSKPATNHQEQLEHASIMSLHSHDYVPACICSSDPQAHEYCKRVYRMCIYSGDGRANEQ